MLNLFYIKKTFFLHAKLHRGNNGYPDGDIANVVSICIDNNIDIIDVRTFYRYPILRTDILGVNITVRVKRQHKDKIELLFTELMKKGYRIDTKEYKNYD